MIVFEIIILLLIYIFCFTFSIAFFMEEECSKVERIILFLVILVLSPLLTTVILGVYLATILYNYHHE